MAGAIQGAAENDPKRFPVTTKSGAQPRPQWESTRPVPEESSPRKNLRNRLASNSLTHHFASFQASQRPTASTAREWSPNHGQVQGGATSLLFKRSFFPRECALRGASPQYHRPAKFLVRTCASAPVLPVPYGSMIPPPRTASRKKCSFEQSPRTPSLRSQNLPTSIPTTNVRGLLHLPGGEASTAG